MAASDHKQDGGQAVGPLQDSLQQSEPAILVSYGLIGAMLLLGGGGYALDWWLGTSPWLVLVGLLAGLIIGLYSLSRVALHD